MLKRIAIATGLALFVAGATQAQTQQHDNAKLYRGFEVLRDEFSNVMFLASPEPIPVSSHIRVSGIIFFGGSTETVMPMLSIALDTKAPRRAPPTELKLSVDGEVLPLPSERWRETSCNNGRSCWSIHLPISTPGFIGKLGDAMTTDRAVLRIVAEGSEYDALLTSDETREMIKNLLLTSLDAMDGWRPSEDMLQPYLSRR